MTDANCFSSQITNKNAFNTLCSLHSIGVISLKIFYCRERRSYRLLMLLLAGKFLSFLGVIFVSSVPSSITRSLIQWDFNDHFQLICTYDEGDNLYFWLQETRIHQVCCHHTNVLNMMKAWQDERHLYMAFEFCPQGTLGDLIRFALDSQLKTTFFV